MKFASIFFTASAQYLRVQPQRYKETSEKYEVYFNIFHSECAIIFEIYLKDTKKRVRNMKFASIFFTASTFQVFGSLHVIVVMW